MRVRGRPAVILRPGADGAVDRTVPVPYVLGVVTSTDRTGRVVRAITTADGARVPVRRGERAYTLSQLGVYPCGMLAAVRAGRLDGLGTRSVAELTDALVSATRAPEHRDQVARHDLGDGCACPGRGRPAPVPVDGMPTLSVGSGQTRTEGET